MNEERQEVITFKAPESLKEAMKAIPNRSEFIRSAILFALDHVCPLCGGSGILNPEQMNHWNEFAKSHAIKKCGQCKAFHLVCNSEDQAENHP